MNGDEISCSRSIGMPVEGSRASGARSRLPSAVKSAAKSLLAALAPGGDRGPGADHFGPFAIERGVRKSEEACGQGAHRAASVRSPVCVGPLADDEVESVVSAAAADDSRERRAGRCRIGQGCRNQRPARRRTRIMARRIADVGDERPPSGAGDAEPRTPSREVASGEPPLAPPRGRSRPSCVELVAIGGDDEIEARVGVECDDREAHGRCAASSAGTGGATRAALRFESGEALDRPPAVAGDPRSVQTADACGESAREGACVLDGLVDFHPRRRIVAAREQAAGDAGTGLDVGHQRADRFTRGCRIAGDPMVDVEMRRRSHARSTRQPRRPRGSDGAGIAYGSGSARSAVPPGAPRRTSPLCVAAICTTAIRSQPPPGAAAALTRRYRRVARRMRH